MELKKAKRRFTEIANKTGIHGDNLKQEPNMQERDELWDITRVFLDRIYILDEIDDLSEEEVKEYNDLCYWSISALHWNDLHLDKVIVQKNNGRYRVATLALALCLYIRISKDYKLHENIKKNFILPHAIGDVLLMICMDMTNIGRDVYFEKFDVEFIKKAEEQREIFFEKYGRFHVTNEDKDYDKILAICNELMETFDESEGKNFSAFLLTYINTGKGLLKEDLDKNKKYLESILSSSTTTKSQVKVTMEMIQQGFDGKGLFHAPDEAVYEGEFKDGKFSGKGKLIWPDGENYDGEWKDGNPNGKGIYNFTNGDVYYGEFKNGEKSGSGEFTHGPGDWEGDIYEGEWKNDQRSGHGVITFGSGEFKGEKYDGQWKDSKRNGKGTYHFADGTSYVGTWKDGDLVEKEVELKEQIEKEDDYDSNKGYPAINVRVFKNENGEKDVETKKLVSQYIMNWQEETETYNGRMGITAKIPDFFQSINESCPKWTKEEIKKIRDYIEENKVIPSLSFVPDNLLNFTKQVWWLVPFVIWQEKIASWVFIDKNGIYAPHTDDNDGVMIFSWDKIDDLDLEWEEDNLVVLTLECEDGSLTFSEFVGKGMGSYLSVIESIYNVYKKTIEVSADSWYHGAGGEGYHGFDNAKELLNEKTWKGVKPTNPAIYGYAPPEKELEKNGEHIKYESGISYQGEAKGEEGNRIPHGKGVMTVPDGPVITGEFKDGFADGHAKMDFLDGEVYEGEFKENKKHGKGIYVWPNGNKYEGEWENDKENGNGVLNYTDGAIYEGYWQQGEINGIEYEQDDGSFEVEKAKYTSSHQFIFEGVFTGPKQGSQRTINGTITTPNGLEINLKDCEKYVDKDLTDAYTSMKNKYGSHTFEYNDTDNGILSFERVSEIFGDCTNEEELSYEMDRVYGLKINNHEGYVILKADDNEIKEALEEERDIESNVIIKSDNRAFVETLVEMLKLDNREDNADQVDILECEKTSNELETEKENYKEITQKMIDDGYTGKGTATWPDGDKYLGEWKDGKQDGQGTYTSGEKVYKGLFKNGKLMPAGEQSTDKKLKEIEATGSLLTDLFGTEELASKSRQFKELLNQTNQIPFIHFDGENDFENKLFVIKSNGEKATFKQIYDELGYMLNRGPFFYFSECVVNYTFKTFIIFVQDGWILEDPNNNGEIVLYPWDVWGEILYTKHKDINAPVILLSSPTENNASELSISPKLDFKTNLVTSTSEEGNLTTEYSDDLNATMSFAYSILERYWQVVEDNRNESSNSIPMEMLYFLNEKTIDSLDDNLQAKEELIQEEIVVVDNKKETPPKEEKMEEARDGKSEEYSEDVYYSEDDLESMWEQIEEWEFFDEPENYGELIIVTVPVDSPPNLNNWQFQLSLTNTIEDKIKFEKRTGLIADKERLPFALENEIVVMVYNEEWRSVTFFSKTKDDEDEEVIKEASVEEVIEKASAKEEVSAKEDVDSIQSFRSFMKEKFPTLKLPKNKPYAGIDLKDGYSINFHVQKKAVVLSFRSVKTDPEDIMRILNEKGLDGKDIGDGHILNAEPGKRNPSIITMNIEITYSSEEELASDNLRENVRYYFEKFSEMFDFSNQS